MFEDKKIGAPSLLRWTGASSASVVRGVGFEASQLLKLTAPAVSTTAAGIPPVAGEQVYLNMWKERGALRVFVKDGRVTRTEVFDPKGQLFASVFQNAERYRKRDCKNSICSRGKFEDRNGEWVIEIEHFHVGEIARYFRLTRKDGKYQETCDANSQLL